MNQDKWHNKYYQLVTTALENINNEHHTATRADTALVLTVMEEYLENGEESANRCIKVLQTASQLIESKHTVDNLSWFDIYESVIIFHMEYSTRYTNSSEEGKHSDINEIYKNFNIEDSNCSHNNEFIKTMHQIVEFTTSEESNELQKNSPYPDDEETSFNHFAYAISMTSDTEYDSISIPNNLSRMRLSNTTTKLSDGVKEDEFTWVVITLKHWLTKYVRAESNVANDAITHDELREYMIEQKTPAEVYFK